MKWIFVLFCFESLKLVNSVSWVPNVSAWYWIIYNNYYNYKIIIIIIMLILINKQPSITVKNPCLQLVRIDHVISVYLSLISKTAFMNVNLCYWTFTPGKVVIYQSIHSSYLHVILQTFWCKLSNFLTF